MSVKHGSAKWQGGIRNGKGTISTESGALNSAPYGFGTRFKSEAGTNPEELIGAAHAACFSMALSKEFEDAGVTDAEISTGAAVTIEISDAGINITSSALTATVSGKGDPAAIRKAAEDAKAGCPVSKVLNCEITLDLIVD